MVLKLKQYNNDNPQIDKLYLEHFGKKLKPKESDIIYGFYSDNKLVGYIIYLLIDNKTCKIDWIFAPGFGKELIKRIESKLKKSSINKISLNVSVDPNESKPIVMKRLNFYIGLGYKVFDIKYRKDYGPLLSMSKDL